MVIVYGKLLLRPMSAVCELDVTGDDLLSMQGVAIVRDAPQGAFINVVNVSDTSNKFKEMTDKLETAENRLAHGYPFKMPSTVARGDAKGRFSDLKNAR